MGKKDNGFLVFYDWREAFTALSGDECKSILTAMFDYAENGTEPPEFEGLAKMAACFIFPAMKRRKESVESGSKGGFKKAENAALKMNAENTVENAVGNDGDNSDTDGVHDIVYPPTTPLNDMCYPPNDMCLPQDKDKDKTKTKQNIDYRQDEDKTVTVSSVVGLSREICKWLEYPKSLSRGLCSMIESSEYGYEDYRRLFETANECDFLKGKGERGWKADLEWLIEHRHEVISGKYRSWEKTSDPERSSFDTDEFFEAALRRSYGADFNVNTEDKEQ